MHLVSGSNIQKLDLFCLAVSDANISVVVDPQQLTFDHLYVFLQWNSLQFVASNNKGEDTQIEEEEQQSNLVHLFQRKALAAKRSNNLKLAIEYTKTYRQLQLLKNKDDSFEPSTKEKPTERVLKNQPQRRDRGKQRRNMKEEEEKRKRKGQRNEQQQKGRGNPEIVLESSNLTSIVPINVKEPTKNQIRITKAERKGTTNIDEQINVKIAETTETKKQKIGAKVEEKQMKDYVNSVQSSLASIGKPTLDSFRSAGLEKGATGLKSKVIKHLLKKLGLPSPNKSQMKGKSLLFLVFYCCYIVGTVIICKNYL